MGLRVGVSSRRARRGDGLLLGIAGLFLLVRPAHAAHRLVGGGLVIVE